MIILGVVYVLREEAVEKLKRMWRRSRSSVAAISADDDEHDNSSTAQSSAIPTIEPGQHIFCYRSRGLYSHHGIYEGDGKVIHYIRTDGNGGIAPPRPPSPGVQDESNHTCYPRRRYTSTDQEDDQQVIVASDSVPGEVIRTCLDCFRRGRGSSRLEKPRLYSYGVPRWRLWFRVRGSGTAAGATRSPSQAIETAQMFLSAQGFGKYQLFHNNCEHFATFCCTGTRISKQTAGWALFAKFLYMTGISHGIKIIGD